nr:MAG TPA: hypothetical protein [Caudoviricetes sp.]
MLVFSRAAWLSWPRRFFIFINKILCQRIR